MGKKKIPKTTALRALDDAGVAFEVHLYDYESRGGTAVSSRELGVEEHSVVKTLIMEDDAKKPLVILMHGDCEVSTKQLARHIGVRSINPCKPEVAQRHSGYQVGGTSPFGLRNPLPIYAEASIRDIAPRLYINGGRRGLLVSMDPAELERVLSPEWVEVAITR